MVTSAMSGGPGVEAHTALSAARCRARVHRLQYFCRRRIWAAGVEGRFRGIFQAELDHFRCARPAQLRDKGQHEIDACRDAAPGQDIAVPDNAALIHDGTEDRKQLPPCPVAGRTAAVEKASSAQNERPGAHRSQIARACYYSAMRAVGFYVAPGFQMLDLAGPAGAFEAANDRLESPAYRLHVLAADKGAVTSSLGVAITGASLDDAVLDTLVVTGGQIDPLLSAGTLSRVVETSRRCRRVVSVCTGAFALAAAGLLDGRRATTHWRYAARLQREYPSIRVEADRIFCRDGNVWTSAGITAGID